MGAISPQEREPGSRTRPADARPTGLAHDLANIVQALNGNLELLSSRTTDEAALRYLGNARAAARQLTELTARLQGAARPALGERDPD